MSHKHENHEDKECKCGQDHTHACECGSECACGCGCGCDCHSGHHFLRRFSTREEKIAALEKYLQELKLEMQAVEEHLGTLRE